MIAIQMRRIPQLGLFPGFDFEMPALPDFSPPPAPPPPAPPPPAPPPEAPPAPPAERPELLQPEFLFPVAGVLACPMTGGYVLRDPVTLAVVGTSAGLPPGAQLLAAGDTRCAGAPAAPAMPAVPPEVYGIPTSTLLVGGAVVAGIALIALLT